jgi:hypothetical protein
VVKIPSGSVLVGLLTSGSAVAIFNAIKLFFEKKSAIEIK